ncbi:PEP-CTERM sorting domain-containing protein [Phycisphaeraceae bacterium D3-23]
MAIPLRCSRASSILLTTTLLLALIDATPALAQISATGEVSPAYGGGDVWNLGNNDLIVGAAGVGELSIEGGTVEVLETTTIGNQGTVTLVDGWFRSETIDHTQGGTFDFLGGSLRVDTFNGDFTNQGGTLVVGHTLPDSTTRGGTPREFIGITTVNGDYTQQSGATMTIDINAYAIGSDGPGVANDQLDVAGELVLSGTLEVTLPDNLIVQDQQYDILDWGTLQGRFTDYNLTDIPGVVVWDLQHLYTTGVISTRNPGDFNNDRFVGAEDLDILLAHWGETSHPFDFSIGDTSGDGIADQADLDILISNWGEDNNPPTGLIPEPGSLALLGLGGLTLLRRRR